MRLFSLLPAVALLAVAGCASIDTLDPQRSGQAVSLVDSLSFTNAMSGQPDALYVARPLGGNASHTDYFPMAQLKQCGTDGGACRWGVMTAQRVLDKTRYLESGVALQVEVKVDVDRRQQVKRPDYAMAMAIPADVPALQAANTIKRDLVLDYGKVQRIEFPFGVVYHVCATRMDAARQPMDKCDLAEVAL